MAERRVKLKSSDDEMFEVEESVAFESQAVKNMIEDTGMDHPIPLPNVSSKILAKVIEYCKYHVDNQKASHDKPATPEDEIKAWDLDFVKVDQATLFDLILAEVLESSSGTVLSDFLLQRRRTVRIDCSRSRQTICRSMALCVE
ncbi:hypothetical protein BDL97_04G145400 [Sphagnum fallax]|nr:hypothetical protein BDL97_04G145400 [Sphagnum fallax]